MDTFWLDDINILFIDNNKYNFVPTKEMTLIQKLNAITRFCIYGIILGLLFGFNEFMIYLLMIIIILCILVVKLNFNLVKKNNESQQENLEKLACKVQNLLNNDNKLINNLGKEPVVKVPENIIESKVCKKPTNDNPMMNRNLIDNLDIINSCEYDKEVKEEINDVFKHNLYQDIDDVFERFNSQRQFYTNPNNNIINNQKEFAEWCYKTSKTCKENGECLKTEDNRYYN